MQIFLSSVQGTMRLIWVIMGCLMLFVSLAAGSSQPQIYNISLFSRSDEAKTALQASYPSLEHQPSLYGAYSVASAAIAGILVQRPQSLSFEIPIPNALPVTAQLERYEALAPNAITLNTTAFGETLLPRSSSTILYRGKIQGHTESLVSFCFSQGTMWGLVTLERKTYNVGLIKTTEPSKYAAAQSRTYIICEDNPMFLPHSSDKCGVTEHEIMQESSNILPMLQKISKGGDIQSNKRLQVQIAIDVDYATYQAFGNSTERTTAFAKSLIATVSQIYERDLNTELVISYLNVWTTPDPYRGNSTSSVLDSFTEYWRGNKQNVQRHIAHLFSSRSLGGGRAWINVLCNKEDGYGVSGSLDILDNVTPLPTYSWDVKVVAHEIGHNFSSPHTHSCLWPGGAIDSCYSAEEGECFKTTRGVRGTIMSYCNRAAGGSVDLSFHPLCAKLMRATAEKAICVGNEALPAAYLLSGSLRLDNGAPAANLALNLRSVNYFETEKIVSKAQTDANGRYSFSGLVSGKYRIELPSLYAFTPMSEDYPASIIVAGGDVTHNATITRAYIVTARNSTGKSHYILIIGSTINGTFSQWGNDGKFTFNLPNGTYSLIATSPETIFSPSIQQITVSGADATVPMFVPSTASKRYSITGSVIDADGKAISGVVVKTEGAAVRQTTTDKNGAYILNNLSQGEYKVTASATGYDFRSWWTYQLTDNDGWYADFRAPASPKCSGTTVITDNSGVFSDKASGSAYSSNTQCSWLITPKNGGTVTLAFSQFNTEDCCDFVTVYDGATKSARVLGKFSGAKIPSVLTSSGAAMLVVFETDNTNEYAGWTAQYSTSSSPAITLTPPVLESPTNQATVVSSLRTALLAWQPSTGATAYHVVLYNNCCFTFQVPFGFDTIVTDLSLRTPPIPTSAGGINWYVKAIKGNVESEKSSVFSFFVAIPVAPSLVVNKKNLDFASISVGQVAEQSLTLSNPTNTSAVITGSASIQPIVGSSSVPPFSIVSGGSFSLQPGQIQTVRVLFQPLLVGDFPANLVVTHSAASIPTTIALSGTATKATTDIKSVTLRNFNPQTEQSIFSLDRLVPRDSGFVHGTNDDYDRAKATAFSLPVGQSQGNVKQVNVWFGYRRIGLSNQTYRIDIYKGSAQTGPQGQPIASSEYRLAGINALNTDLAIILPVSPTQHVFSSPVTVGQSFFVSVDFGVYGLADVANAAIVASSQLGRRVPEDWERASTGVWYNMSDSWFPTRSDGWNMWIEAVVQLTTTDVKNTIRRDEFALSHYPNPCSELTTIQYTISQTAQIQLELYSVLGVRLATLLSEKQGAGNYVVPVDVRLYPSGQYFYRLHVNGEQITRSLQVVR